MAIEQAFTRADIIESLETMIRNSDHGLMDDGKIDDGHHGSYIRLKLRDGSVWCLTPVCVVTGVPKERNYLDDEPLHYGKDIEDQED